MKKALVLVLTLVLVLAIGIGGTVAYLTSKTEAVVNTFTMGNVNITLAETTGATYKVAPGETYAKDPKVTVAAGSEASYIFVKVEKSAGFDDYFETTIDSAWTALTGVENVYYIQQADLSATGAVDAVYSVLAGNEFTVKNVNALPATAPTLTFTAYAIQSTGFADAAAAWTAGNTTTAQGGWIA